MTASASAPLSLTSEGLRLLAGHLGVAQLPALLRIRSVLRSSDALTEHPHMAFLDEVLAENGIGEWIGILARPDVQFDVQITKPDDYPSKLLGPTPLPPKDNPEDPIGTAEALAAYNAGLPTQRVIVICRRDNKWVSAARLWRTGDHPLDEVVLSALDHVRWPMTLLGHRNAVQFPSINIETERLSTKLQLWQSDPGYVLPMGLASLRLNRPQANIVEAVADAGTTRSAISAALFTFDGEVRSPLTVTVADTLLGRVLITNSPARDGRMWTTITSGDDTKIAAAIERICAALPSPFDTHQRIQEAPMNA